MHPARNVITPKGENSVQLAERHRRLGKRHAAAGKPFARQLGREQRQAVIGARLTLRLARTIQEKHPERSAASHSGGRFLLLAHSLVVEGLSAIGAARRLGAMFSPAAPSRG